MQRPKQVMSPPLVSTGAAMDVAIPRKHGRRAMIAVVCCCCVVLVGLAEWHFLPHGLQVNMSDVRISTVERTIFFDEIAVRASVVALNSVLLDSSETGKVDEVFVDDGAVVKEGDKLFRLSNPQRRLDLLQRQSEYAQQLSNLSTLQAAFETSQIDHQRRISELEFNLSQSEKEYRRKSRLAAQAFISPAAMEESADLLSRQRKATDEERGFNAVESKMRRDAIAQMKHALGDLQSGLSLARAAIDALTVRAPASGQLTDFHLQVGETVKLDEHIGRIDDPAHFKLTAQVDEYYLNRIAVNQRGSISSNGNTFQVRISRLFPQIKEGRFTVEIAFVDQQPQGLRPGQNIDAKIKLGEPTPALLIPNGSFMSNSGGAWVFVVGHDGVSAERRPFKIGRRSNAQLEVLSGLSEGERIITSSYVGYENATKLELVK
jgi:HlyD family secretion protein